MPTVRENIAYTFEHFMLVYRGTLLKVARAVAIIALIALALEVIVFNINFFTSSGYRTINLDDRIQLQRNDEGAFLLTDVDHTLEFSSLNTEVRNIRIDFDADQPAQNIAVKIQFTDSAHQTYFDTTEYTVGIPDASVSTVVDPSKFINLQTAGYVENLRIEVVGEDVSYPILLNGVSPVSYTHLNAQSAGKDTVSMPTSKKLVEIVRIMEQEGYIQRFDVCLLYTSSLRKPCSHTRAIFTRS